MTFLFSLSVRCSVFGVVSSVEHQIHLRAFSDLFPVRYVLAQSLIEKLCYDAEVHSRELFFRPTCHLVSQNLKVHSRKI